MKSPVTEAREQLSLTLRELALLAGVTEQTIRTNERGMNLRISDRLLSFFDSQGFDKERMVEDYSRFRDYMQQQTLEDFKANRA